MNQLAICSHTIRQDKEGRFNLNDLHRATEGQDKDRPGHFLVRPDTGGLIRELLIEGRRGIAPVHSVAGRYGGTHAVREVVYAYAMWISPKFHLQVILAYDSLVTGKLPCCFSTSSRANSQALVDAALRGFEGFQRSNTCRRVRERTGAVCSAVEGST